MSEKLNHQINYYLTGLLAFFAPVHAKILPLFIILLVLNWLSRPTNVKKSIVTLTNNYGLLTLVLLFVTYLLGMLYTTNTGTGFKILETKLSLVILPLVYAAYTSFTKEKIINYLRFFVWGCVAYAFICFGYATYAYFKPIYTDLYGVLYDLGGNYFFYSYLTVFFHPSYTALYSVLALTIIVLGIKTGECKFDWKALLATSILTIFILLLSSKAGWIIMVLLLLYTIFLLVKSKKIMAIIYIIAPIVSFFLVFNVYYTPEFSKRIPDVEHITEAIVETNVQNEEVTTGRDGNASRVFIWKASWDLFKDNIVLGQGTGDAKDVLMEKYEERGMTTEFKYKLNSHNQYLTTAISIGAIGLLVLILCLFYPFIMGIRQKDILPIAFTIFIAINFLFESMLETQAGLVFYAFFNTLLCSTFVSRK